MKFEWESLYHFDLNSCSIVTSRSKVFGGWIVNSCKSIVDKHGLSLSESMVFVPDPKHKWVIE